MVKLRYRVSFFFFISFPQSPVTYGIYYTPLTRTSRSLKYGPELSSWPNCSPAYNTCSRKARAPYSLPLQPDTAFPSFSLLLVPSTPQDCWLYRSTLNSSFSRTGLPKLPTTPNLAPAKHGQLRALLVKNLLLENFFQKYWNSFFKIFKIYFILKTLGIFYFCFAEWFISSLWNFIPGTIRLSARFPTCRATSHPAEMVGQWELCVTATNTLEQPVGSLCLSFLPLSSCIFSLSGMKESMWKCLPETSSFYAKKIIPFPLPLPPS